MIVLELDKIVNYNHYENISEKIIYYPKLFDGEVLKESLKNNRKIIPCLLLGLAYLTNRVFSTKINKNGAFAMYCKEESKLKLRNIRNSSKISVKLKAGTIVIFGSIFRNYWTWNEIPNSILFYQVNPLSYIYLTINDRIKYSNSVKTVLKNISVKNIGKQCVHSLVKSDYALGSGCYGSVYYSILEDKRFAIKISKIKPEAMKSLFGDNSSWFEINILNNIIRPILQKNKCPNLPLIIEKFVCNTCDIPKNLELPKECVITIMELASGDLYHYLKQNPSEDQLYSCIFQVMAGLHAIQLYGQIMNFDIKKENILYYNVEKGGYWHYQIHGKDYYVPNHGQLFVINDFGISRPMSPKFPMYRSPSDKTFRLGSRFGVVKNGKFVPLNTSQQPDTSGKMIPSTKITWQDGQVSLGAEFRMKRDGKIIKCPVFIDSSLRDFLHKKGVKTNPTTKNFFLNPEIIPPFEFFNDTQDAIRMFIGGKRTTQKGNHAKAECVTDSLYAKLNKFKNKSDGMKNYKFSTDPAQVLAGYFIESFFSDIFRNIPNYNKIETFILS